MVQQTVDDYNEGDLKSYSNSMMMHNQLDDEQ